MIVFGAIYGTRGALAQVQDLGPQVILIGLNKPGLETIRRLQNMLPGVGIIALTLVGAAKSRPECSGGRDFANWRLAKRHCREEVDEIT